MKAKVYEIMLKLSCVRLITEACSISFQLRSINKNIGRNYANAASVKMAYNVYEEKTIENNPLPPLIVMHGLFGSKNNFRSVARAVSSTTGRKVG